MEKDTERVPGSVQVSVAPGFAAGFEEGARRHGVVSFRSSRR
jgi:hypothetical protein